MSKSVDLWEDFDEVISNGPYPIRFPSNPDLSQSEEWCEVKIKDQWKRIRFHDYNEVYKVPGLYETIFYRTLRCNSPHRVAGFLEETLAESGVDARELRVLDFGAGNGMAAEALQNLGIRKIVGVDLLPEAEEASIRDRPWVYDCYKVLDFTRLSSEDREYFENYKFNALCTVAALGFGDIPPLAFYNAFNFISEGGYIAFNIKDEFLRRNTGNPFAQLVDQMIQDEIIQIEYYKRYQHRLSVTGHPLFYVGIVATKNKNIPESLV